MYLMKSNIILMIDDVEIKLSKEDPLETLIKIPKMSKLKRMIYVYQKKPNLGVNCVTRLKSRLKKLDKNNPEQDQLSTTIAVRSNNSFLQEQLHT